MADTRWDKVQDKGKSKEGGRDSRRGSRDEHFPVGSVPSNQRIGPQHFSTLKRTNSTDGLAHHESHNLDVNGTGRIDKDHFMEARESVCHSTSAAVVGQYVVEKKLGQGQFGGVFKASSPETGQVVAVKRIPIQGASNQNLENEINILKNLDHPHIVKYYGIIKTSNHFNIILEFVESGSLAQLLTTSGLFPEPLASMYIEQVLLGLHHLHSRGIVHRDIKGSNLLITEAGVLKLADFGIATFVSAEQLRGKSLLERLSSQSEEVTDPEPQLENEMKDLALGSPFWMDPDIIHLKPATPASDIWSLGCTVIELITGYPPYFDMSAMAAMFKMVKEPHPPVPNKVSADLENFLMTCFRQIPNVNPTAMLLLGHPWILKFKKVGAPAIDLRSQSGYHTSRSPSRDRDYTQGLLSDFGLASSGGDTNSSGDFSVEAKKGKGGGDGKRGGSPGAASAPDFSQVPTIDRLSESLKRYNTLVEANPDCDPNELEGIDWVDPNQDIKAVEKLLRGTLTECSDDDDDSDDTTEEGVEEVLKGKGKGKGKAKFDFKDLGDFQKTKAKAKKKRKEGEYTFELVNSELKRNFLFSYTVYTMRISDGKYQWKIYRTWTDFRDLHVKVQKLDPSARLPSLPPAKFFGSTDSEFVKKRGGDLRVYLEKMAGIYHVLESDLFNYFLRYQKDEVEDL